MHPFIEMDEVARIQPNAKKGIAQAAHHRIIDCAAFNAYSNCFIPGCRRLEIGTHQLFNIVSNAGGQFLGAANHEAGAAVESAHEACAYDDGIAWLDQAHGRARQAVFGARA